MKSNSQALLNLKKRGGKNLRKALQAAQNRNGRAMRMYGKYWGVTSAAERKWIDKHKQSSGKKNQDSPASIPGHPAKETSRPQGTIRGLVS